MYTKLTTIILIALMAISCSTKKYEVKTLTNDGAWCWFSDPRAIYVHPEGTGDHGFDQPGIQTGWVKEDGTIEAMLLNKDEVKFTRVLADKLDKDDHANPAFVELENGKRMTFYTKHFDRSVRYHWANNAAFGDVVLHDPFDAEELKKFPLKRTTYANPYYLESEQKLYCFGRWTGFKPNMMVSDDMGKTFSKSKVLITNYPFDGNNRPYAKYYSNGKSKIHIVFTDGHPRNELTNSVYYAYYENNAFWKANGTKICNVDDLPFEPKDATLVYNADEKKGKSWVFDVAADKNDNPVILYTRYPDDENHEYYHTWFDGEIWVHTSICNAGRWFPQTPEGEVEREPNYSGGLTVNPLNPFTIYTSEKVDGIFEIYRYQISKKGKIKNRVSITSNSKFDNVRPFFPRNMKKGDQPAILWMQNYRYIHYTDYKTAIKYCFD